MSEINTTCPCCGSSVVLSHLLVDLNTNTVSFDGKTIKARPRVIEILSVMADTYPRVTAMDHLRATVWTNVDYLTTNDIRSHIFYVREVVAKLGWRIVSVWKRGYRLERIA